MNLVSKEFVSARDDEGGVLILSTFAGAAWELRGAIVVNPYDLDECAQAMIAALAMRPAEQRDRMRHMRAHVAAANAHNWGARLLSEARRYQERPQSSILVREHALL
jgi:trehalose 6-phosphate synthase